MASMRLPSNYLIHYLLLLACRSAQIDACCLDTLVPHEVGKKGDIIESVEKVLCESMTERVRVNHIAVKAILFGKGLQLNRNASCGKAVA